MPRGTRAAFTSPMGSILQVKMRLIGISPMIWRRVLLPVAGTLEELHGVIQAGMGWEGLHLYEFRIRSARYGSPELCAGTADVATAPPATTGAASDAAGGSDIAQQIRDAVTFVNQTVLGSSTDFIAGLRAAVEAMAHALETINRSAHAARVHLLQEAALAATLAAMLREPEKAKEYETVLQVIQRMG